MLFRLACLAGLAFVANANTSWPPVGESGSWKNIGPWGIGDDIMGSGEAGTLADAVSPASNPNLIYAGGKNNGGSSGVLKSVDMGKHWTVASNGLFDTHVYALGIVDEKGEHLFVAVRGAIYETTDGAEHWELVKGSEDFGSCTTFKNGTINDEPYIFASCNTGIANIPVKGGDWNLIPPGDWSRTYLTISDSLPSNSVLGGCVGGKVIIGTVINTTAADWKYFSDRPCTMLALNPNNKDHFIYTKPPLTYQSIDGGKTFESLNHSNIFHCGIDRQGWLYTAAMGGAFVSKDCGPGPGMKRPCSWERYYVNRTTRRTNETNIRAAHDYQRISQDFGGRIAFTSDQGLYITPDNTSSLELIKANGNLSNVLTTKAAISAGDGPGKRYIVAAVWDWAPLASWDSGAHWPSWQTPAGDGAGGSCIGEGGGSYGMGTSNKMLLVHHHNILSSFVGGKNLTRFVVPHGATVFAPTYQIRPGSLTAEPDGSVYAPLFMGPMPWKTHFDKTIASPTNCTDITHELPERTNSSCLATLDLGVSYGWYKDTDYAEWSSGSASGCRVCQIGGNSSLWEYTDAKETISYSKIEAQGDRAVREMMEQFDVDGDGRIDEHDLAASMVQEEKLDNEEEEEDDDNDENLLGGRVSYVIKNFNYGQGYNWTWTQLPPYLSGIASFITDPSSNSTLYGISPSCISRSLNRGDNWGPCWNGSGLTGSFSSLVIKDSQTMLVLRKNDLPLRTQDGGKSWHPLTSCTPVGTFSHGALWSWTGKTLVLIGSGGTQTAEHPHAGFLWRSTDDGDTWTDETAGLVTMSVGAAQWYENEFYIQTYGEGILSKILE